MNEPTPNPKPASKKKAAKSPATVPRPRAPSTVDPAEDAIRVKAKLAIEELRSAAASRKILATIIDKRLPKLTPGDKERLLDHLKLKESVTPALPGVSDSTLALPHPDGGMSLDNVERELPRPDGPGDQDV